MERIIFDAAALRTVHRDSVTQLSNTPVARMSTTNTYQIERQLPVRLRNCEGGAVTLRKPSVHSCRWGLANLVTEIRQQTADHFSPSLCPQSLPPVSAPTVCA